MRSSRLSNGNFPDTFGEDKLVVIMGALHIEDKMISKLLRDTGWATILSRAEVLTSGRAQSTLNEHHIKRTRYAHQVSLVSLYMLKQNAYVEYCNNVMGPPESYSLWNQPSQTVPQFKFWSMKIELELHMTRFVRSLREGDFPLQCASMRRTPQLVPRTGPYELRALAPCACP